MAGLVFNVSLTDLITGPAKRMQQSLLATSKALMVENQDVLTLQKSIAGLERAMVKSAALGNEKAYQKQAHELGLMQAALGKASTGEVDLANSMKDSASSIGVGSEALAGWVGAALAVVEVVGKLVKGFADLVIAGAEFTVQAVQSKQAAQQMFRAMAGGKEAGDQLFSMMEDLATQLPQTKDELTAWSKEFTAMGILKQDALRTELHATASAAALMGDEGAEAFTMLARKITEAVNTSGKLKLADKQLAGLAKTGANVSDIAAEMGVSTKKLSDELKHGTANAGAFGDALNKALIKKGVEPLNTLSGSMKSLSAKFQEAIGDMFEDVDISPFVEQMRGLLAVFTQAEPSGQAMKAGIGAFFKSFFEWTAKAILVGKHMFLQLIIWGLKAYIALKPYMPLLKDLVKGLVLVAAVIAGTVVFALTALAVGLAAVFAPAVALASGIMYVYDAIQSWGGIVPMIKGVVGEVVNTLEGWLASLVSIGAQIGAWAVDAAGSLVSGLVSGIANGTGLVVQAVKDLAHNAMTSFKKTLGISSPSKEFMKLGGFTASGFVAGVSAQNDNAAAATQGLAQAAMGGAQSAPAPVTAKPASGGGVTVTVESGAIVINGATGDAAELTENAVSLIFEKIALKQGVAA